MAPHRPLARVALRTVGADAIQAAGKVTKTRSQGGNGRWGKKRSRLAALLPTLSADWSLVAHRVTYCLTVDTAS